MYEVTDLYTAAGAIISLAKRLDALEQKSTVTADPAPGEEATRQRLCDLGSIIGDALARTQHVEGEMGKLAARLDGMAADYRAEVHRKVYADVALVKRIEDVRESLDRLRTLTDTQMRNVEKRFEALRTPRPPRVAMERPYDRFIRAVSAHLSFYDDAYYVKLSDVMAEAREAMGCDDGWPRTPGGRTEDAP